MKRVFPLLSFLAPRDRERALRIFHHRDNSASLLLVAHRMQSGLAFAKALLNHPPHAGENPLPLLEIQSDARAGDEIVAAGRFMIDLEQEADEKKSLPPGYTDYEAAISAAYSRSFLKLTRSYSTLAEPHASQLPPHASNRAKIKFYQGLAASYHQLQRKPWTGDPRTAVFVLREKELWAGGPAFVGAWGMDGTITLIWAHLLLERYGKLLEEPGFVMAELRTEEIPHRPTNLDFALDWELEILVRETA